MDKAQALASIVKSLVGTLNGGATAFNAWMKIMPTVSVGLPSLGVPSLRWPLALAEYFPNMFDIIRHKGVENEVLLKGQSFWKHPPWVEARLRKMRLVFLVAKVLTAGVLGKVLVTLFRQRFGPQVSQKIQDYVTSRLYRKRQGDYSRTEILRRTFVDLKVARRHDPPNHTHPTSASVRSTAVNHTLALCQGVGLEPSFVQMSKQDQARSRDGTRDWRFVKDLQCYPVPATFQGGDACVYVDVDMYLDMGRLLCERPVPHIVCTFQPAKVAESEGEYVFTFDAQDVSHVSVSGGGRYSGSVWNYSTDHLMVAKLVLGIPVRVATYMVDRKTVGDHYDMVLLSPVGAWSGVEAVLAYNFLTGTGLERLRVHEEGFLRLRVHTKDGMFVSTGRPGSLACATIPAAIDDALSDQVLVQKADLTTATVLGKIGPGNDTGAPALAAYHRHARRFTPDRVCPVGISVQHVQFGKAEDDFKPLIVPFMTPLIEDGCFAPVLSQENEEHMVRERITNMAKTTVMDARTRLLAEEFQQFLFPIPHVLVPLGFDEVRERQDRPSQVALIEQADDTPMRPAEADMMEKKEAYPKVTPQRPITIIKPPDKVKWSQYLYAMADYAKIHWPWYQPGKNPLQTAESVAAMCRRALKGLGIADYRRYDGSVSPANREFEAMVTNRAFQKQYMDELAEYRNSQIGMRVRGTFGTTYDSQYARGSGSPETGLFNTMDTAFVFYMAMRDAGMEPAEAYANLGQYCGDDSATPDVEPELCIKAAARLGQEMDMVFIKRGETGVKFLARLYGPDVWWGDANSMCDLRRQLTKLHTTPSLPSHVTPAMKIVEKARSYALSDANTPVMGAWCECVLNICPAVDGSYLGMWGALWDREVQYPNEDSGWMFACAQTQLPEFDFGGFYDWVGYLQRVRASPDMVLNGPCFMKAKVVTSVEVVINGEVVKPEPTPESPAVDSAKGKGEEVEPDGEDDEQRVRAALAVLRELKHVQVGKREKPASDALAPADLAKGQVPSNRSLKRAAGAKKKSQRAEKRQQDYKKKTSSVQPKAPGKAKGKGNG